MDSQQVVILVLCLVALALLGLHVVLSKHAERLREPLDKADAQAEQDLPKYHAIIHRLTSDERFTQVGKELVMKDRRDTTFVLNIASRPQFIITWGPYMAYKSENPAWAIVFPDEGTDPELVRTLTDALGHFL